MKKTIHLVFLFVALISMAFTASVSQSIQLDQRESKIKELIVVSFLINRMSLN